MRILGPVSGAKPDLIRLSRGLKFTAQLTQKRQKQRFKINEQNEELFWGNYLLGYSNRYPMVSGPWDDLVRGFITVCVT